MKTCSFVLTVCVTFLLAVPAFVQAQDFRTQSGAREMNTNPSRTFLGLPIPQQWTGNQPASVNQYSPNGSNRNNSYSGLNSSNCANGQCQTGNSQSGRYTSGQCANGQCPVGQSVNGNCPGGQCPLNQNSNARYNSDVTYGGQGDWSPRTTRSNVSDPFRGVENGNGNDNWTQRPALRNPVRDLYPSRYNQNDLDLRRPYFNNQSGDLNETRAWENSSAGRDIRAPRPSDRSMLNSPADRAYGLAQI